MNGVEWRLWSRLRLRQLDNQKFRRQVPLGPYVVDFACLQARLAIEIDGPTHDVRDAQDAARTASVENRGFRVLRFTADEVVDEIDGVVEGIRSALAKDPSPLAGR